MVRSVGIVASPPPAEGFGSGSADFAGQLWWERRLRNRYFPAELFGEPAWDLLLDLLVAAKEGRAVRLSKAHLGACVAPSMAERRAKALVDLGVLATGLIKPGSRILHLTLTASAKAKLERLLEETWFHRASGRQDRHSRPSGSERDARLQEILETLERCREGLDEAEAWQAGAYVCQAISLLDRNCAS